MAYKVFANTLLVIAVATLVIFPPLPNLESIAPDGFNLDIGTELTAATVISFDADTVNDYLAVLSALAAAAAIAAIIGAIIAIVVGLIALIKWIWKQFRKGHRLKE
ncbi:MAG: hypothetical protein OXG88_01845 [Gammaproteobacteria bacterium]|nr:hypothetical protein [Gammaproteobacteria bacterium]